MEFIQAFLQTKCTTLIVSNNIFNVLEIALIGYPVLKDIESSYIKNTLGIVSEIVLSLGIDSEGSSLVTNALMRLKECFVSSFLNQIKFL